MQRARHRKSKSASGIEGLDQIHKQKTVISGRRSTDSRPSYLDRNKRDDMFMLHFGGPTPYRESSGVVPMKKLLAEEMSREVEPKKRAPGLIARLMGFEGLPSTRKQHHQKRRESRTDLHEFKDVYEDLEASTHRRFSSRWSAGPPDLTKLEMARIEQKLVNSRRLSNGERDHIAVLKPSNLTRYESKSRDVRKDGLLLESHGRHITRSSPARTRSSGKNEENVLPTRIVVLKPNLGKEYSNSREVGLSRPISKEARELAREITMRMRREGCDESIGYIGDESSYDETDSEPEDFRVPSRKSLDDNRRYLSSSLGESSVSREARRRLSERWRMSREYRELEVGVSKGSTLGEMLSLPDRNGKTRSSGISSRDGWMDEVITRSSSSRSKSLPPYRGHKRSSYRRDESKFVKRSVSHKEDYSSSSKYMKSWGKKPHPGHELFIDEIKTLSDVDFEIRMEANVKDISEHQSLFAMSAKADACRSPAVDLTMLVTDPGSMNMSPESCESFQKESCSVIDGDGSAAAAQEDKDCSFQELHVAPPSNQGSPSLPCPVAEPESSENYNKQSEHPSPNSVLEVPVAEDTVTTHSSESFERVNAELQELRLQLKLLKMESTTDNADGPTIFPIEEEGLQASPVVSEGNYSLSEPRCWEYSYAIDVLITSGIQDSDFNTFKASWHSQDCPLDPKLFEDLEMHYNEQMAGTKLERRILFDRINWVMLQISLEYIDLTCPWVMPKLPGFNLRWQREGVRDAVEKLIEEELSLDAEVSDRGMQWSSCKGEIEMIGNEIETVLIEEMMAEVVMCM